MASQKSGEIQSNESLPQLMNNFIADLAKLNEKDYVAISRDLKVRLRVDSSGNWELLLLTGWV
jgi:hypothetical protein